MFTVWFAVTKEADIMPKRRANGEGNIRKRKDGRWEGRYTVGRDPETGKAIIKNVLGKTQAEVKDEQMEREIFARGKTAAGRAGTQSVTIRKPTKPSSKMSLARRKRKSRRS